MHLCLEGWPCLTIICILFLPWGGSGLSVLCSPFGGSVLQELLQLIGSFVKAQFVFYDNVNVVLSRSISPL